MKWLIPWNMLHIVPALNIVQNAASTCLPFLVVVPVVPTGCGLTLDIESAKPWPNFIRSTYRYYSLITFQVGCISCHPFFLSMKYDSSGKEYVALMKIESQKRREFMKRIIEERESKG